MLSSSFTLGPHHGQDTQTFLVLGSPSILTRKWCVGEMVTARANKATMAVLEILGPWDGELGM
jgi:hypothetical protein